MREDSLSLEELESELARAEEPILVAFGADRWRPSEAMLERVRGSPNCRERRHQAGHCDPMEAACVYQLMTLPTLLLFSGGEERVRIQGVRGSKAILGKLGPWLGPSHQTDRAAIPSGARLGQPEKSGAR